LPDRDTEIEQAIVGAPPLHNASIDLADYDPCWPSLFDGEEARIREALGPRCLLIQHVGSTSVPGLSAKPIIDMVLEVPDSAAEPAYVPDLEAAGYVLRVREPDWFEHRLFKGPDVNVNLHVFSAGCPETRRMLVFRDHLRSDEADRELYQRTKQELAQRTWKYVQHYADAKSTVVAEIMARASTHRLSVPAMDSTQVQGWLDDYVTAWRANEREPIAALFSEDVVYRYRPYGGDDQAVRGNQALVDSWLDEPDDPASWEASYQPYAVDGDRAVATGYSRYFATDDEPERTWHNCFLLRFDDDGRCAEFTEFYMEEPPAGS
jgi:GrpB-like predicted nucleotidyltransferase (UPF0157 family)